MHLIEQVWLSIEPMQGFSLTPHPIRIVDCWNRFGLLGDGRNLNVISSQLIFQTFCIFGPIA